MLISYKRFFLSNFAPISSLINFSEKYLYVSKLIINFVAVILSPLNSLKLLNKLNKNGK